MHRFHPDPAHNDPPDAILFDHCDRCSEHAATPHLTLSHDYVAALWQRMVDTERNGDNYYRTRTEAEAAHVLYAIAVFLERAAAVDPWSMFDGNQKVRSV